MQLKPDWVEAGITLVKVISPLEAIVRQANGQLMYLYGKEQELAARPTDNHVYTVRFHPGGAEKAWPVLRKFGFSGGVVQPDPNTAELCLRLIPLKYAVQGDPTLEVSEEAVEAIPGVEKCIYRGCHKPGTRWEYRDGDLYA